MLAPAGAFPVEGPAVEVAVRMPAPDRAFAVTRVRSRALAAASGFHGLRRDEETGWTRTPMAFERDAAGVPVFETEAAAGPSGWFRIPLPFPDAAPAPATDLSFAAEITPPAGYRIVDAFPAGTVAGNGGALTVALPAPPSLLRFRVIPHGDREMGVSRFVDLAVGFFLLALAAVVTARLLRPPRAASPS